MTWIPLFGFTLQYISVCSAEKIIKISQQPENCENRNDPDLVQAFLKKWWVESDFKALNLPLSLRLKVSGCHYNSMYNNTSKTKMSKIFINV
jgi:hypothetical protein